MGINKFIVATICVLFFTANYSWPSEESGNCVAFKTHSSNNSEGFASVRASRVLRVEKERCSEGDPVEFVYQVLVEAPAEAEYRYMVFATTEAEAKGIMEKLAMEK